MSNRSSSRPQGIRFRFGPDFRLKTFSAITFSKTLAPLWRKCSLEPPEPVLYDRLPRFPTKMENGKKQPKEQTAFRMDKKRKLQLKLIQKERGHVRLSDTIREAIDFYVDSHLRGNVPTQVRT